MFKKVKVKALGYDVIFAMHIPDKGLISRIYNKLQSNKKKANISTQQTNILTDTS